MARTANQLMGKPPAHPAMSRRSDEPRSRSFCAADPRHRRGLTEFLPGIVHRASAAGRAFPRAQRARKVFEVLIQLGAILALVVVYFWRLVAILRDAIAGNQGALAVHSGGGAGRRCRRCWPAWCCTISSRALYASPIVICVMLIVGGVILLYVDQLKLVPKYTDIYDYPPLLCLYIGLFQMLAWCPACRAPARPSSARCCSAPTSARPPSSASFSPCR